MTTQTKPDIPAHVWIVGKPIPGYDPVLWRHDDFGSVIYYFAYGDRSSDYGWEVDHIVPSALGGISHPVNYRPLHHRNNSSLGGILGNYLGKTR